MITIDTVREIALAFPGTEEHTHWDRPAFRVKKKIFATIWPVENKVVLILTPAHQSVYTDLDNQIFYPVDGGWGRKGATYVDLSKVKKAIFKEAISLAWNKIAIRKQ